MEREQAEIGVLITMQKATRPMRQERQWKLLLVARLEYGPSTVADSDRGRAAGKHGDWHAAAASGQHHVPESAPVQGGPEGVRTEWQETMAIVSRASGAICIGAAFA